jgi:hypothetical protein
MQKTSNSLLKEMLRFPTQCGLAGGALAAVYVYFLDYTQIIYRGPYGQMLGYLAIIIMPLITFFALRRMQQGEQNWPIWKLFLAGVFVSLVAAVSYSILSYVYTHLLVKDYPEKMAALEELYMRNEGKPEADVLKRGIKVREHYRSMKPLWGTLLWYAMAGVVYSLISVVLLNYVFKKKEAASV